jgi:phosphoglycerate dehydrogenase-like enzyme
VLVTAHAAALSARENERIVELFVDNLRRYLDGRPLRNVVEAGVYY